MQVPRREAVGAGWESYISGIPALAGQGPPISGQHRPAQTANCPHSLTTCGWQVARDAHVDHLTAQQTTQLVSFATGHASFLFQAIRAFKASKRAEHA